MRRLIRLSSGALLGVIAAGCGALGDFSRLPSTEGMTVLRFTGATQPPPLLPESPIQALSTVGGGIQLYVQGVSGTAFSGTIVLPDENTTQSFSIPNGTYKIAAVSWSSGSFQGTVRCGFGDAGNEIRLTGGTKTVQLTLSTALCAPAGAPEVFAPSAYFNAGEFNTVEVVTCKATGFASVAAGGSTACDSAQIGRVQSMRVELSGYKSDGVTYRELPPMPSSCVNVTAATPYLTTAFKLPLGNTGKQPTLAVRIVTFDQPNCESGGPVTGAYIFPYGLANTNDLVGINSNGNTAISPQAKIFSFSNKTQLYLREML